VAATIGLIEAKQAGLFHVTNAGSPSWFEFASGIFEQAGVKADLSPTTSDQFKRPAKRPPFSVLSCAKLASAGVPAPRPWREALGAYLAERKKK
jgi:dTDP-4-dehydrorhamnose reductase